LSDLLSVEARFDKKGKIYPKSFERKGLQYSVGSIGRQWEEEGIYHILVMDLDEKVYELAFDPSSRTWHLLRSPQDFGRHQAL
jgi:hypothetical protein